MFAWVRVCLVVCCLVASSRAWAREDTTGDEQLLRSASIATDDRALLDFFRKQTADEAMIQRIRERIEQLGSDSFPDRESASKDLANLGPVALMQLRQAIRETVDLEVRHRARECVKLIASRNPPSHAIAVARLLARRQPAGATETLLAFLPGPYDDSVLDEIQTTLVEIARVDGRVHAELRNSLASTIPARRTVAALVLCRVDVHVYAANVRKLLDDREASVRFSVARALAYAGDRQTLPVLIDLLALLPREQAEQVEEILYRLAGPNAPLVALGVDPAEQRRCREAWLKWWDTFGERIDMAALKDRERQLGYTLLVLLNDNCVVEWDRDGKPHWQIKGLASPLDAEVLTNHRVLIAEYETKRVTERSLMGEILWLKQLATPPIHAQRLPDGRTFIATRSQLIEVAPSGAGEIVRYRSEGDGIITARRYDDGRIACIEKGSYFELSVTGKELRRFAAPAGAFTTNSLTLLPNGHLLIAAYSGGTVQEFDRTGKVVWEVKLGRPLCAVRLPGGNTLVSTQDMVLVEFDRSGKTIARRDAPGHPCQIRRR